MRYVILGGGGSFGLATARYLLTQPETGQLFCVGRAPAKPLCFTLNTGHGDSRYCYVQIHVTYQHDLLMTFLDSWEPEVIINFAAQGEGATSFRESWRYFETNCVGLARLVEELHSRKWLKRFVHIGTSELYGATNHPAAEDWALNPTSPYAISKAAFEQYLIAVHRKSGFPMNIVRPSNCYGEGQQLHRLVPRAALFGLTGRKLPLHGGGRAEKSYMHTEDLARAILAVCERASAGEVYNAGPANPTVVRHMVEEVARALNLGFDELAEEVGDRDHQDSRYWLDSRKASHALGWQPRVTREDGVARVVRWVREHLEQLRELPTEFVMRP